MFNQSKSGIIVPVTGVQWIRSRTPPHFAINVIHYGYESARRDPEQKSDQALRLERQSVN
jgi:hypothetical protein